MDMGAGYNPSTGNFRKGNGQVVSSGKQSFEDQAATAL
jgi:hypothetical protein